MQITQRDLALLRWINGFGFVFTRHVAAWMKVSYHTAYDRIRKLKSAQLIQAHAITRGVPYLLHLTRQGWKLIGEDLPPLTRYRTLNTFNHDVRLIELSLMLRERFPESRFVPERWVRFTRQTETKTPCPDGILYLGAHRGPIAIELELTRKRRARLHKILRTYQASLTYDAVWYFTSPETHRLVTELAGNDPLFAIEEVAYSPCL